MAGEAYCRWLEDEPQVSVRGLLEQGPAAIEEAASFGGEISFGVKRIRQSYDTVARFQLQSRAENHDFLRYESQRKEMVPERPRREISPTALKGVVEDRRAQRTS